MRSSGRTIWKSAARCWSPVTFWRWIRVGRRAFGTPEYDHHPSFDGEAASWLLEKKIKLLACDFATPDLVYHLRQPGFDWPVHHILLANGILVCEHLTNHAQLAGSRAEFFFGAMPLVDGDGAPARVAARLLES